MWGDTTGAVGNPIVRNSIAATPHDNKFYCPQLGTVLELGAGRIRTELVSVSP